MTFPQGSTCGMGRVLHAQSHGSAAIPHIAIITDQTPFHPVDHSWPDQPADRGQVTLLGDQRYDVVDVLIGTIDRQTGALLVGEEITVRRGDPDHAFVVVHVLRTDTPPDSWNGQTVVLGVEPTYRNALSAAHTACHLVALALNEATNSLWRKDSGRRDSLGRYDFDATAIVESRIIDTGSVDRYRLGSSLRRAGFDRASLIEELPSVVAAVNTRIAEWLVTDAPVVIAAEGPGLSARRYWQCDLPVGQARMLCGGTHTDRLGVIPRIQVSAVFDPEASELTVTTRMT